MRAENVNVDTPSLVFGMRWLLRQVTKLELLLYTEDFDVSISKATGVEIVSPFR